MIDCRPKSRICVTILLHCIALSTISMQNMYIKKYVPLTVVLRRVVQRLNLNSTSQVQACHTHTLIQSTLCRGFSHFHIAFILQLLVFLLFFASHFIRVYLPNPNTFARKHILMKRTSKSVQKTSLQPKLSNT